MTRRRRDPPHTGQASRGESEQSSGGLVKLFYRIGEVAHIVGVAPHVLRYWETEFPTVKPQKSNHGQRVYTKRDVHKLLLIKHLLKEQGLTIAGARKQLRSQSAKLTMAASSRETAEPTQATASRDDIQDARPNSTVSPLDNSEGVQKNPRAPVAEQPQSETPQLLGVTSKSLRQALLNVRQELVGWLE